MSERQNTIRIELITSYIHGTMTNEEANTLLAMMQDDSSVVESVLKSVMVDSWLAEVYKQKENLREIPLYGSVSDDDENSFEHMPVEELLQSATDWERNATPLVRHNTKSATFTQPETVPSSFSSMNDKKPKNDRFSAPFCIVIILYVSFLTSLCLDKMRQDSHLQHLPDNYIRVMETIDAVWEKNDLPIKRGHGIGAQELNLQSGMVLLKYPSGSKVILDGPTQIILYGQTSLVCSLGNISMDIVSQDRGFEITTPFSKVIDQGTRFSLNVGRTESDLNVIQGQVDLQLPTRGPQITLWAGQGGRVDQGSNFKSKPFDSSRFIDQTRFDSMLDEYVQRESQLIDQSKTRFDDNPGLIARFDCGTVVHQTLPNLSQSGQSVLSSARITGGKPCAGILPGMKALLFKDSRSRIEADIAGKFSHMTIVMNVRIDRLENSTNVLFASDGLYKEPGTIAWQVMRNGLLRLFVVYNKTVDKKADFSVFDAPDALQKNTLGTWMSLAVVFDPDKKTIVQYCDGRRINTTPWPQPIPLSPGKLTIANNSPDSSNQKVSLNGALDSFYLFNRALSEEEIKQLQCSR